MTEVTEGYIKAAIAGDKTISDSVGKRVLAILSGKVAAGGGDNEILKRDDVAKKLKVCAVTVTNFCKRGYLHAVRLPGRRKAIGITKTSVDDFMSRNWKVWKDEVRG